MSENNNEQFKMPPKRPRGPMGHGPGMVTEKARDFNGSTKKLIKYLGRYWAAIIAVMIFAAVSTVFSVAGPKVMGKATTALAEGLMNKIAAYKLQEEGMDTVDANIHLGFKPDERDYGCGAQMLRHLGVHKMRLMTNNPVKRVGLEAYGLEIVENIAIETTPNKYNERYLKTKRDRMGHVLHLG